MQILTTARHFTLDPDIRSFAQDRLERLARFLRARERNGVEIHLVVTAEKHGHSAEVTLRMSRHELVGRGDAVEARAAIDLVASRLEQRLRRLKDRVTQRRKGGRAPGDDGTLPPTPASDEDTALNVAFEDESEIEE